VRAWSMGHGDRRREKGRKWESEKLEEFARYLNIE